MMHTNPGGHTVNGKNVSSIPYRVDSGSDPAPFYSAPTGESDCQAESDQEQFDCEYQSQIDTR